MAITIKNAKLEWTSVIQPNQMSGKYQTDFYVDEETEKMLIEEIDKQWNTVKGKSNNPQTLSYKKMEDGRTRFKASQKPEAGGYTFEVNVYDSKAKKITKENIPSIGNGTVANLSIDFYAYDNKATGSKGVTLQLKAIQIVNLIEYTGADANFDEVDGGYEVSEEAQPFAPEGL